MKVLLIWVTVSGKLHLVVEGGRPTLVHGERIVAEAQRATEELVNSNPRTAVA